MLYLRNSTTHKALAVSDSEKFKAALSMQMSLVFLDYYSKIVYKELKKQKRTMLESKSRKFYLMKKKKDFLDLMVII